MAMGFDRWYSWLANGFTEGGSREIIRCHPDSPFSLNDAAIFIVGFIGGWYSLKLLKSKKEAK
jgi:hypothetical protein